MSPRAFNERVAETRKRCAYCNWWLPKGAEAIWVGWEFSGRIYVCDGDCLSDYQEAQERALEEGE